MDWVSYLLAGLGLVLLYRLVAANLRGIRGNNKKEPRNRGQGRDFSTSQSLHSGDGTTGLAFDRHRKKLRLLYSLGGSPVARTLDYHDLLACEIREDGRTVAKSERAAKIRNPSLGRMPASSGDARAQSQDDRIGHLELKLILNDPARAQHRVVLLDNPTRRGGPTHRQADADIQHWYRLMKVLIHQADSTEVPEPGLRPLTDGGDAV